MVSFFVTVVESSCHTSCLSLIWISWYEMALMSIAMLKTSSNSFQLEVSAGFVEEIKAASGKTAVDTQPCSGCFRFMAVLRRG